MLNEHFNAGDFFNCDLFVCKYEHRQYFYPAGSIFSNWEQFEKKRYYHWEFLSMGLLVFFSVMISSGLKIFPSDNLSLLGVIPMFIGVKIWLDNKFESKAQTEEKLQVKKRQIISVTLIGLANGADNIGIYVPVFS